MAFDVTTLFWQKDGLDLIRKNFYDESFVTFKLEIWRVKGYSQKSPAIFP